LKVGIASCIVDDSSFSTVGDITINLDDKLRSTAIEISDVMANRMLASEREASTAGAQGGP
jgi:hypothetical protein